MDYVNILLDIIGVMIREQKAASKYTSDRLISKILNRMESGSSKISLEDLAVVNTLMKYIREMLEKKSLGEKLIIGNVTRHVVMALMKRDTLDTQVLQDIIRNTLTPEEDKDDLKSSIKSLHNRLYAAYVEMELLDLNKSVVVSVKKGKTRNAISILREKLEEFEEADAIKDDAIISEIIFTREYLENSAKEILENVKTRTVYKTGYKALNIALQGGVRSGDCVVVSALSHHNKTGFSIGMVAGIGVLNKFTPKKRNLKPLILHLSFEDPETMVIAKYYNVFINTYHDAPSETPTLTEMAEYIQEKFSKSGAEFMIAYVDPTLWSHVDLTNYIKNLESKGYDIKLVLNDYLDNLPSTDLSTKGPTGADRKELLRRARNFFGKRGIVYITPWQMGPKANDMVTNGLDPLMLPKFAAGKSMYQGNSTLDTDIDVEILLSKGTYNDKWYQAVAVGKHRLETVIPKEDLKYFFYAFPETGPIPLDEVTGKKGYAYRLSNFASTDTEDGNSLFSI